MGKILPHSIYKLEKARAGKVENKIIQIKTHLDDMNWLVFMTSFHPGISEMHHKAFGRNNTH